MSKQKIKYDPKLKTEIYPKGMHGPVMESYGHHDYTPIWAESDDSYFIGNEPFYAKMKLIEFIKSASSFKLMIEDEQGIKYFMRHTDFTKMVLNANIINATIEDTFVFVEQNGTSYIVPLLGRELNYV